MELAKENMQLKISDFFVCGSKEVLKSDCHVTTRGLFKDNMSSLRRSSEVAQLCLTLCNPVDCSPPGSSV